MAKSEMAKIEDRENPKIAKVQRSPKSEIWEPGFRVYLSRRLRAKVSMVFYTRVTKFALQAML
jgi:hypothetical protein